MPKYIAFLRVTLVLAFILVGLTCQVEQVGSSRPLFNREQHKPIVRQLGGWPPAGEIEIRESYAYVGFGDTLAVIDISDPTNLLWLGGIELPNTIKDIRVVEETVYATSSFGLWAIDVSNPAVPQFLDDFPANNIQDIEIRDHYLYFVQYIYFVTIDIANPADLVEVSRHYVGIDFFNLELIGAYAVLSNYAGYFAILLDISVPTNPVHITEWHDIGGPEIVIDKDILYRAGGSTYLNVATYSVADLMNPQQLDNWNFLGGGVYRLKVDALYAYISTDDGLHIFGIADPYDIEPLFYTEIPGAHDFAFTGKYMLIANQGGLTVLERPPLHTLYLPAVSR